MEIAIVTGSAGLVGSEAVKFFTQKGLVVIGIDNDMRKIFFGDEASTDWNRKLLENTLAGYTHYNTDIRDKRKISDIFAEYGSDIRLVLHAAAQPSHDWAASDPVADFSINANGTLNLLEMTRKYCSDAVFIFTSTNKVYGDTPNYLPLMERSLRWEIDESHVFHKNGIDESMSIDQSTHSLFGASKVAADILVQEYGRYFGIKSAIFRGGCLTGPSHSAAEQHGFLAYLMKCAIIKRKYTIFGYKGKQVRDNIHSYDLANSFWHFYQNPKIGEVYNMGGGRFCNCSILESISKCEEITGNKVEYNYSEQNRNGDHIWWISDVSKFKNHYPDWQYKFDLDDILSQLFSAMTKRATHETFRGNTRT